MREEKGGKNDINAEFYRNLLDCVERRWISACDRQAGGRKELCSYGKQTTEWQKAGELGAAKL